MRKEKYIFEDSQSKIYNINSDLTISVINTYSQFKEFYNMAFEIYKDNKYWVAPLWKDYVNFFKKTNIFWNHAKIKLFNAYKKGKVVGRICAIIDKLYINKKRKKIGFFGFFECINDPEVGISLLENAETWLKNQKMDEMKGPINGRVDMGCGFLIKGFDSIPYLLGHYSHKYYNNFVNKFDMKKSKDLLSYNVDLGKPIPESLKKKAKKCEKKRVKIRKFNRFKFNKELKCWYNIFMEIFKDHWGYINVPFVEFKNRAGIRQLRWIVDPELFLIAEIDNKSVGFRCSFPDYNILFKKLNGKLGIIGLIYILLNRRKIDRGRFIVMGIKKEYRGRNIGSCLNYYNLVEMKKRGYKTAEYGWIDEDNIASIKAGGKLGAKLYKIYRVYEKSI